MRTCYKCKTEKPLSAFYSHKTHGHRYDCVPCARLAVKVYRQSNLDKARKSWKASQKKHRDANKALYRDKQLQKNYGITLMDYSRMLEQQRGACAICSSFGCKTGRALAVDHCHKTGRVRGLLCAACNRALGNFKDSTIILDKAKSYLQRAA
jgi:hypothetical protein